MTNYMDGNWHDWHGGECPVPGDVEVEVVYDSGASKTLPAGWPGWSRLITRFRVLNPQPTQTGPVRTVTRTEIVPGVYGNVMVEMDEKSVPVVWMNNFWTNGNVEELTAAIETLTAIRDALAEQETQV